MYEIPFLGEETSLVWIQYTKLKCLGLWIATDIYT